MFQAAGFPVFAVFKDELATRKSLKAFFLQPINTKYSSESFFFLFTVNSYRPKAF